MRFGAPFQVVSGPVMRVWWVLSVLIWVTKWRSHDRGNWHPIHLALHGCVCLCPWNYITMLVYRLTRNAVMNWLWWPKQQQPICEHQFRRDSDPLTKKKKMSSPVLPTLYMQFITAFIYVFILKRKINCYLVWNNEERYHVKNYWKIDNKDSPLCS